LKGIDRAAYQDKALEILQAKAKYTKMRFIILLGILAKLEVVFGLAAGEQERDEDIMTSEFEVEKRNTSNCGTDSAWEPTPSAYIASSADTNLRSWWKNISSSPPHGPLPNELAQLFGSHEYEFSCGIGDDSTCAVPGCSDFDSNGDPPWTYLALESISQLNVLFNAMYAGVSTGQEDYQGLIGNISEDFFTWGDGQAHESSAASWGSWAAETFGGWVGNAVGGAVDNAETSVAPGVDETQGVAMLGEYAVSVAQELKGWIQDWANTTFNGDQTSSNETLL
jgi:hypothetical protein